MELQKLFPFVKMVKNHSVLSIHLIEVAEMSEFVR